MPYLRIKQKQHRPFVPKWLPQYERYHDVNGYYNANKNIKLMEYLNNPKNHGKSWNQLPIEIKQSFGYQKHFYFGYLKYKQECKNQKP